LFSELGREESVAIRLVEITKDNLNSVLRLKVSESQNQFVTNNAVSILQGTYEENAWFRGIFIWRYMIAEQHQSKGYGKCALLQIIDMVRGLPNAKSLSLSCLPADDSPRPLYEKLGFAETGEVEEGERVMKLDS
jgi:diamine N-acetyltransferase